MSRGKVVDKTPVGPGSETYIASQQRKKELLGQAVSGPIRAKNDPTMDAPKTSITAKGGGGAAAKARKSIMKTDLSK